MSINSKMAVSHVIPFLAEKEATTPVKSSGVMISGRTISMILDLILMGFSRLY